MVTRYMNTMEILFFVGQVTYFFMEFNWKQHNNDITVHFTEEAFAENLNNNIDLSDANIESNLYRAGRPVNRILHQNLNTTIYSKFRHNLSGSTWIIKIISAIPPLAFRC